MGPSDQFEFPLGKSLFTAVIENPPVAVAIPQIGARIDLSQDKSMRWPTVFEVDVSDLD